MRGRHLGQRSLYRKWQESVGEVRELGESVKGASPVCYDGKRRTLCVGYALCLGLLSLRFLDTNNRHGVLGYIEGEGAADGEGTCGVHVPIALAVGLVVL